MSTTAEERRRAMLKTAMGPAINEALSDPTVIEVMVNPDGRLWLDRLGEGRSDAGLRIHPSETERIIRLVASHVRAEAHADNPVVSAELPSGERFEGVLPPVSKAPCFAIRKPAAKIFTLTDYVRAQIMVPIQAEALRQAVRERKNILVAGGTSSGKTTLANALLAEIADCNERVILIEDTRELQCAAMDCVALRTRPGVVSLADLVRSTLRLRPDRIVVGEVRGAEALDMLKAWNTGHPGGIATVHANSARSALYRIEQLVQESVNVIPRRLIADAIDMIVFIAGRGSARRVETIAEVSEYRNRADRLADLLPWAALIAPGIVLNKDGSFQRSFRFRGPDLESATEAELVGLCARANNALKRLGSGWALFFEAERLEAQDYPQSNFPDAASWLVDEERRAAFEEGRQGRHFESRYHLTLLYMPPPDAQARTENALLERDRKGGERDWRQELARFEQETQRVLDLMSGFLPEIRALDDAETLTFLHGTISPKRHPVNVPETPMYLDGVLVDTPLTGGLEPMLGDWHLRTLTILGFPNATRPGILDALNHQNFAYRWATRFVPLDKTAATKVLTRLRRQWFAKRKSITAILREVLTNEAAPLVDNDADNKALDADAALQALGGDNVGFGYLTTTITVWDEDREAAEEKARAVERIVNGLGFTCIRETINAVEAWLGSLPGHVYANVRQPLVHTLNLAHLMPLSAVWAGPARNAHLDGPPLLHAETSGSTPFRLSTHVGDVGHMLIVGPTGAGKSVLLSLIALQFRRYADSQVYIFDKGNSARAAVLAMGGEHHALGAAPDDITNPLAFQPLRDIDDPATRSWAAEWIGALLVHEKVTVTPEVKEAVWSALGNLATAPAEERTLTGLSVLVQANALKAALQPYTLDGPFGRLLDAAEDRLVLSDVQCFETEELMHEAGVVLPVLTYLFHRLEERFDGRPTLLILDEAWVYLDNPLFAARIREWLKVLRKKNVSVIFATQSLADVADSSIAPAIIESCPQRIFLPNDRAIEPQARAAYERFGLNDRQIELIARATPKRNYYLQSRRGNRLFELGLGPVALALCGASDPATQTLVDTILAEHGREAFTAEFLNARGLDWAADLVTQFPQHGEPS